MEINKTLKIPVQDPQVIKHIYCMMIDKLTETGQNVTKEKLIETMNLILDNQKDKEIFAEIINSVETEKLEQFTSKLKKFFKSIKKFVESSVKKEESITNSNLENIFIIDEKDSILEMELSEKLKTVKNSIEKV